MVYPPQWAQKHDTDFFEEDKRVWSLTNRCYIMEMRKRKQYDAHTAWAIKEESGQMDEMEKKADFVFL